MSSRDRSTRYTRVRSCSYSCSLANNNKMVMTVRTATLVGLVRFAIVCNILLRPTAGAQAAGGQSACLAPNADSHGKWDKPPNAAGPQGGPKTQYAVGTTLHLQCKPGYTPYPLVGSGLFGQAGPGSMKCGNGGGLYPLWTFHGDFPYCKSTGSGQTDDENSPHVSSSGAHHNPAAGQCNGDPLPMVQHGVWRDPILFGHSRAFVTGETTTLQCQGGYDETSGGGGQGAAPVITCDVQGWAGDLSATCTASAGTGSHPGDCGTHPLPTVASSHGVWEDLRIFGHAKPFRVGDTSKLTCEVGYAPTIAPATITCTSTGWSGSSMADCQTAATVKTRCIAPAPVNHGVWSNPPFGAYKIGAIVYLTCAQGYQISPKSASKEADRQIRCSNVNGHGQWTGNAVQATCLDESNDRDVCYDTTAMKNACGAAKRASVGYCLVCIARNKAFLECPQRVFDEFCSGDGALLL